MSRLEKLAIRGIRSFSPLEEVKIDFFRPLTLIQGHNGSGKTTIIECLKMVTCGSLPPLSTNGKTFINDPKISNSNETKASIKLKFLTPKDKSVIAVRNFQLSIKNKKYEFKRWEQIIKSSNQKGELVTINSTCMDIDKQIPLLMHASRAIIENVIFCHQEEINWPFSEAGNLKKVFDEIFDTAKYTKALEDLKETNKSYTSKTKDWRVKIELIQKDYEQYTRLNHQINLVDKKMEDLTNEVTKWEEDCKKCELDLIKITKLEQNYKEFENGINLAKAKVTEKQNQMQTILSDPMFEDYTQDESTYNAYVRKYQESLSQQEECVTNQQKINALNKLTNDWTKLTEECNNIEASIISKQQTYTNYTRNKKEMIDSWSEIEDVKITTDDIIAITEQLTWKETEIKGKCTILDTKQKQFNDKINEKENDLELSKYLYKNKENEIAEWGNKKVNLINMITNVSSTNSKILQLDIAINEMHKEISEVNYRIKETEAQLTSVETKTSKLRLQKMGFNTKTNVNESHLTNFNIVKWKEKCNEYTENTETIIEFINKINKNFHTNYATFTATLLSTLNEIISFLTSKQSEIIEEKQKIREDKIILNLEIENELNNQKTIDNELQVSQAQKEKLSRELESEFGVFDWTSTFKFQNDSDIKAILAFKQEIENILSKHEHDYTEKDYEAKYLSTYLHHIEEEKQCLLCRKSLSDSDVKGLSNTGKNKINILNHERLKIQSEWLLKKDILDKINQSSPKLRQLENIIVNIDGWKHKASVIFFKLSGLYHKQGEYDNTSKEKTVQLSQTTELLNYNTSQEDLYKIKTEKIALENTIKDWCTSLNIHWSDSNEINIQEIEQECSALSLTLNEIVSVNNEISSNESKINELNHIISVSLQSISQWNSQLSQTENEKSSLWSWCNENEINKKINEIEIEIAQKKNEGNIIQSNTKQLGEVIQLLRSKKWEFDTLYNDKSRKYKRILEKISNWKMKIEYITSDFKRSITDNSGQEDVAMNIEQREQERGQEQEKTWEQAFDNHLLILTNKRNEMNSNISILQKELKQWTDETKIYETQRKQQQLKENIFKNNSRLLQIKKDLKDLNLYVSEHETKLSAGKRLYDAKELVTKNNFENSSKYNINLGKLQELKSYQSRLNTESRHTNYLNIDSRYSKLKCEYILSMETSKEIDNYYEALDQALLKYHGRRMEEINKVINYYWKMTYKGSDIRWWEIRSDYEKIGRSRNYNYKIMFGTSGGQELEMRGRCSAGQKVLASIIIRWALAETFCNNCGILCLDEPTTNWDDDHSRALAKSLREIIQSRSEDERFQLIVITHDPVFVDWIGNDFCDSYWQVGKNEKNFSGVTLKPISAIFNQ